MSYGIALIYCAVSRRHSLSRYALWSMEYDDDTRRRKYEKALASRCASLAPHEAVISRSRRRRNTASKYFKNTLPFIAALHTSAPPPSDEISGPHLGSFILFQNFSCDEKFLMTRRYRSMALIIIYHMSSFSNKVVRSNDDAARCRIYWSIIPLI